jgi:hypothetical protein
LPSRRAWSREQPHGRPADPLLKQKKTNSSFHLQIYVLLDNF